MQAWLLPGFTDIPSMTLGETADPTPAPGEVILALQFAALNPADHYLSIGHHPAKPKFPHILGRDAVGTITALGEGVTGMKVGDTRLILRSEVGVNRPGTLAQRVAVEAAYTTEVPAGWSLEQAAAAPLVYVTAWQALTQWGELPKDAVVLVTGASGGVGVATVQLAYALGHTVIALSRSKEKSARLRELGAALTLDPQDKSWRDTLKAYLSAPPTPDKEKNIYEVMKEHMSRKQRRVDLAIDSIGGAAFNHLLDVMALHGRISVVGALAGPVPTFNTASLFFRRLRIGGVAIASYTNAESHDAWQSVLQTLDKTGARPLIDHIFEFDQVTAAFARLAQGPMGKVLIRIPQH